MADVKKYKLLREYVSINQCCKVLNEKVEGTDKKITKFTGPFVQSEVENKNGRRYPRDIMFPAVDEYKKERIDTRSAYGDLDHPADTEIQLKRASHIVESLEMKENDGIGVSRVLDYTTNGRVLEGFLNDDVALGVSSRGLGALDELSSDTIKEVTEFKIIAIDVVANPSAPHAYIESINENEYYIIEGAGENAKIIRVEKAIETLNEKLQRIPKKDVNEYLWGTVLRPFFEAIKNI